MKNTKSWFSLLSLALLCSLNLSASSVGTPENGNPSSISEQVQKYLQKIDLKNLDEEKTVLVDFMLNDRGEILILSTSDKTMDKTIKSSLNYKTVENHNLNLNSTYTLPIKFRK